ncbi:MAG: O-antigen ligase family protein, partial [Planctomycetes bacterium]|nr:O-antigen ligase family protein [Planctomycetota bacterium]
MIRLSLLFLVVGGLCVYARRDWFASLCGLVLLTTFTQHHDMPRMAMGVPGLNPWNVVLVAIILASLIQRSPQQPKAPAMVRGFLVAYVLLLIVGAIVAILDVDILVERGIRLRTARDLTMDLILNPLKYILVGVLIYSGARSRRHMWMGLWTVVLSGALHALMMYKTMKGMVFTGDYDDARRMTDKMIGLHANDLAAVLSMTFWAAIVLAVALKGRWRWFCGAVVLLVLPAIVGCHSRTAYVALVVVALVLAVIRWRKLLLVGPLAVAMTVTVFPQIPARLGMGFDTAAGGDAETDWNEVTAGRTFNLWAPTFEQIWNSPLVGHGRLAIARTDCYEEILGREGSVASHPHNSYLEVLMDFGILGILI